MKKRYLALVAFGIYISLCCSCSNVQEENVETLDIQGSVIVLNSPELILVEQALKIDDYLVTAHRNSDSLFKAFRLSDGRYMGGYGTVGYGPSDYLDVEYRSIKPSSQGLVSIEASSNQLVYTDIFDSNGELIFSREKSIQIPLRTQFTNDMILLGDTMVIGHSNGDLMKKELFKFNLLDSTLTEFREYGSNDISLDGLNPNMRYELFFKKLVKNPLSNRFAVLYTKYNKIVIYDDQLRELSGTNLSKGSRKVPVWKNGSIDYSNAQNFNLHVVASDKYIFGLTTGETNGRLKLMSTDAMLDMKSEIFVWNWDGEIVKKLILDRPISIIAYDLESQSIIGVSPFVENEIYRYEIPKLK